MNETFYKYISLNEINYLSFVNFVKFSQSSNLGFCEKVWTIFYESKNVAMDAASCLISIQAGKWFARFPQTRKVDISDNYS